MASANVQKKPCSRCDKGGGIFTCDGCQQSFCRRHSEEHRQELATQMDNIGQEHDVLQRDISKEADSHPLLTSIDVWERESVKKIEQVAEQARIDLRQLIDQAKQELKVSMNRITKELQSSRESEDYTELDLKRWIDEFNELRKGLEKSMTTYLIDDENERSIIRFIKVKNSQQSRSSIPVTRTSDERDQKLSSNNYEKFDEGDKLVILSEGKLVATYDSQATFVRSAVVFGTDRYSTGTHCIRFRIEKKTSNHFFFGIVTSSQIDHSSVFKPNSTVNGWWPYDFAVVDGKTGEKFSAQDILDGDDVTLILNCDQKQICLVTHRTKRELQLLINTQNCPFPWKIVIALGNTGNSVRILP